MTSLQRGENVALAAILILYLFIPNYKGKSINPVVGMNVPALQR